MPHTELQTKFLELLKKQREFSALSDEQKKELLLKVSQSSDAQLMLAAQSLQTSGETDETSTANPVSKQKLAQQAVALFQEMKHIDREQLQKNEADAQLATDQDAESLIRTLDKIGRPKRKKLFGIF